MDARVHLRCFGKGVAFCKWLHQMNSTTVAEQRQQEAVLPNFAR
jgi:hypothetical protein